MAFWRALDHESQGGFGGECDHGVAFQKENDGQVKGKERQTWRIREMCYKTGKLAITASKLW